MRLQHVHISDYKNLKDFTLSFDNDSFLDVFVGKNGTGKSNLFEALIEIFRHLNEFGSDAKINFDYSITYEIEGKTTSVEWSNNLLQINGKARKSVGKTPVPDNVLVYYSGHNDRVSSLIQNYQTAFQSRLKGANLSDSRYFLGIGPEYKQLLLATSLLKPEDSPCRRFICDKLGIKESGANLKLTLHRPFYARGKKEYDIESDEGENRFWKAEGITREFLDTLLDCSAPEPADGRIRTEGYQASDDKYILYIDVAALLEKFKDEAPHELFERFDGLKVLEMLGDIEIPLTLTNGEEANTSFFSDGQFQSVYIFAITELFKERHCLTLLDEPDSFLHPEWQHQFLSQVFEISEAASQSSHTLLSSHSASTISSSEESQISLFEIEGNSVKVSKVPKGQIITSLSAGLITFSEREAQLSIQTVLEDTTNPVLFTEGISDEVILETAWKKLYPGQHRPFEIKDAFCCSFLGNLLRRTEIYTDHPGRTFFGLFDFDDAFNEWKGCKGDVVEADPQKCLTKKLKDKDSYVLLLPVPRSGEIRDQVINEKTGNHFKSNSRLPMELLFHGVDSLSDNFEKDPSLPGNITRFKGKKTKFANETVPTLDREHFKVFEPLFEFVTSKCG